MLKIKDNRGVSAVTVLLALAVILLAVLVFQEYRRQRRLTFDTPYQAIVLLNGQAYFGKLENFGAPFPVLTDVYYVQSQVNQETKQVTNTLIRRAKDAHAPDRMVINGRNILYIEPITPGSQVAKLIEELKAKTP